MHAKRASDDLIADDIKKILPYVKDASELKRASVFVTGGTGFIGVWLLNTLLMLSDENRLGLKITVLSRTPNKFMESESLLASRIHLIEGDVKDFRYPAGNFNYIIHAAAETNAKLIDEQPERCFEDIVHGTQHVLNFAAKCGCRKFLYVSSGAVYGRQPSDLLNVPESYEGAPNITLPSGYTAYAEGKRVAEILCCMHARRTGMNVTIARLFAFVGPYLPIDEHFAVGNFIRDALNGDSIHVSGDGTPYRSYLYAADLSLWLLNILLSGRTCGPYNVGSDKAISIDALAKKIASITDPSLEVVIGRPSALGSPPSRYVPSTSKIRDELGMEEHFDLDEAIKRTLEWNRLRLKEHGKAGVCHE